MALSGGGNLYGHAAARGYYDDEILSEKLVALSGMKPMVAAEAERKETKRLRILVRAYLSSQRREPKRNRPKDSWVLADELDKESSRALAAFRRLCRLLRTAGPDEALVAVRAAPSWIPFPREGSSR